MSIPLFQVDSFTSTPFAGNPAAVCLLSAPGDPKWMQALAAEMNLSETAFVCREAGAFSLRWFTPKIEVSLCGHATLAAAHVLWNQGWAPPTAEIVFNTQSGKLTANRVDDLIELDFPLAPAREVAPPADLLSALGVEARFVGNSELHYLVEVAAERDVLKALPDFAALAQVKSRGVIVTARADAPAYDFVSRYFAPAAGIDEDPVTGSAHCTLAPHWQSRLGKDAFVAYQASARGGTVHVRIAGPRAILGGHAVTVVEGKCIAGSLS